MVRTPTRTFVAIAMAVTALAVVSVPAGAQQPVGPNQHFAGLVNGTSTSAVVYTVCAGPASAGRTGPVAGGQTLSVARAGRATAIPGRSPRSTPGSFLRAGRRPHPCNSSSSRTARQGDPHVSAGSLRRHRDRRVQLVPLPRALRFRLGPRLRHRAVREYRGLNVVAAGTPKLALVRSHTLGRNAG